MKAFTGQLNKMALKFHKQVSAEDPDKNVFVSPASLEMALAMTENGAAGKTLDAMKKTLELASFDNDRVNRSNRAFIDSLSKLDKTIELDIANSLWLRKDFAFSEEFLLDNKTYYDAEVGRIDFADPAAADTINNWVSQKTKGKISGVNPPSPTSIIVLANAIYFKGTWMYPFDKSKTIDGDFKLMDGTTQQVPMMSQLLTTGYLENSEFQMAVLEYGKMNSTGNRVSMYVFLPKDDKGIEEFIESLNSKNWDSWTSGYNTAIVDLKMPRFKIEYDKLLNRVLSSMGMGIAFGGNADFSRMIPENSSQKPPFLTSVQQKTFVEVNEEGTEAAAATVVIAEGEGEEPDRTVHKMVVDHPFFFVIRDDASGAILFTGTVLAP